MDRHFDVENDIISEIKAENIRTKLKILTQKPHLAGSEQVEKYLVNFIQKRWASFLDEVEVFPYNALPSFATKLTAITLELFIKIQPLQKNQIQLKNHSRQMKKVLTSFQHIKLMLLLATLKDIRSILI